MWCSNAGIRLWILMMCTWNTEHRRHSSILETILGNGHNNLCVNTELRGNQNTDTNCYERFTFRIPKFTRGQLTCACNTGSYMNIHENEDNCQRDFCRQSAHKHVAGWKRHQEWKLCWGWNKDYHTADVSQIFLVWSHRANNHVMATASMYSWQLLRATAISCRQSMSVVSVKYQMSNVSITW